ncbi:MAG: DUF58 domain-containing protein [Anaerolineales bacterium]|nr:DUF58 domain-containing protein [Anaerolineales bacterium]
MLGRLLRPWRLWHVREGSCDITLEWHNRLPLFVIGLLLVLELALSSRAWLTLLLGFSCLLVIAGWWAWKLARGVRISREVRYHLVQAGDLLEERFRLTNTSFLPTMWVELRDHSDIPGYSASTVRTVGGQAEYRWVMRGECRQRGEYYLGPWEAITWDPFGLFAVVQRCRAYESLLVYPSIARQLPFPLPRGLTSGWAHISRRSQDPTVNVGGVRAYSPGDPRHQIHWPTTARRGRLYSKEFDQETGGDVWLVVDLNQGAHSGSGERSTEELAITVASSVAALMLDARRAVGLIAYGAQQLTVMPERGRGHLWKLLQGLARARSVPENPLERVLEGAARVMPTGSTALVITPALEPTWLPGLVRLQGQGVGTAAVLVDRDSFAAEEAPGADRADEDADTAWQQRRSRVEALRGLLADAGVSSEIIGADTPLVLRPPTGRLRRWEFKVLGTGRAIAVSTPWGE